MHFVFLSDHAVIYVVIFLLFQWLWLYAKLYISGFTCRFCLQYILFDIDKFIYFIDRNDMIDYVYALNINAIITGQWSI